MTTAYFAHQVSDYDTVRERDAIRVIKTMGWRIVNPNEPSHQQAYLTEGMTHFTDIVVNQDVLVFMQNKWGEIGVGVAMEMFAAHNAGIPLFEVDPVMDTLTRIPVAPNDPLSGRYKILTREQTKARNREAFDEVSVKG